MATWRRGSVVHIAAAYGELSAVDIKVPCVFEHRHVCFAALHRARVSVVVSIIIVLIPIKVRHAEEDKVDSRRAANFFRACSLYNNRHLLK